jgi:polar amino acid transport system ATP-binding protein
MAELLKVEARGVCKYFGKIQVLNNVSMNLHQGEIIGLIGPSGAGKSTFLRCINQLELIDRGYIAVDGQLIGYQKVDEKHLRILTNKTSSLQRSYIGMVFQHFNLFKHMTVMQNIIFAPMHVRKVPEDKARSRALELLSRMGLENKAGAYPSELSGGQQQRVAIARALAMDPTLLLFDEPTSALDPELAAEVGVVIRSLAAEGRSMIVAAHDLNLIRDVSKKVIFMVGGSIIEEGETLRLLDSPSHPRTRSFLATMAASRPLVIK